MKKGSGLFRIVLACIAAIMIPGLLILNAIQAKKYTGLAKEVVNLEKKQEALIEENKKLITEISILSSSDRIEDIASGELGMRKAESSEIVRVEMSGSGK